MCDPGMLYLYQSCYTLNKIIKKECKKWINNITEIITEMCYFNEITWDITLNLNSLQYSFANRTVINTSLFMFYFAAVFFCEVSVVCCVHAYGCKCNRFLPQKKHTNQNKQ